MPPPAVADRTTRHATAYEDHRGYVMAVLARRCGWLEPDEREAALHDAWAILLEKEASGALDVDAMQAPQVRAYLVQTAINRALDEGRRVGRTRNEPLADRDDFADAAAPPEDVVDAGLDGARVREIVGELTARQQTIVKLRFFFDRTPGEIQRLLRITERAYRRDLERAMRVVSERYELVLEGRFCESRASLIRAYVAGIAGPNRAREARDHLATCPACRRFAIELRDATGRFAALLPLPALAVGQGQGVLGQVAELLGGGRESATAATAQAKQQIALLTTRVDPTAAAVAGSARPGAVAAAVAGCLALSGSAATYCAVVGVPPPLRDAMGVEARAPREHAKKQAAPKAKPRKAKAVKAAAPAPIPTTTTAARTPPRTTTTRSATTTTAAAARAARVAKAKAKAARKAAAKREHDVTTAQEFGPEGGGEPVGGSTASTASTGSSSSGSSATQAPATSAPATKAPSRDAPTEFDP